MADPGIDPESEFMINKALSLGLLDCEVEIAISDPSSWEVVQIKRPKFQLVSLSHSPLSSMAHSSKWLIYKQCSFIAQHDFNGERIKKLNYKEFKCCAKVSCFFFLF